MFYSVEDFICCVLVSWPKKKLGLKHGKEKRTLRYKRNKCLIRLTLYIILPEFKSTRREKYGRNKQLFMQTNNIRKHEALNSIRKVRKIKDIR